MCANTNYIGSIGIGVVLNIKDSTQDHYIKIGDIDHLIEYFQEPKIRHNESHDSFASSFLSQFHMALISA